MCLFPGLGANHDITLYLVAMSQSSLVCDSFLIFPCFLRSSDTSEVHWSHILYNVSFFGFSIIRPWLCFLKEYCGYKFWKEHHRRKFPANYIGGYLLSARFIIDEVKLAPG